MKIALPATYRECLTVMMLLSVFFAAAPAIAEIRYVSDLLIVSIRQAQSEDSPLIGYLRSDTPVEVIEENEDFVYITTPDNLTGWVKKKFLVSEKPKAIRIEELTQQIRELEDKILRIQQNPETGGQTDITAEFNSKIDALQEDIKTEKSMVSKLETALTQATEKYNDLAKQRKQDSDASEELRALRAKNQELIAELQQLKSQPTTEPSFFSGNIKWFMTGAGVLLLGFIIGRSFRGKRTYGY